MTIQKFPNGTVLDHIAWAVPDTVAGCEQLADMTGVRPHLMDRPEPGAYYWSGGLNLGDGQLLEVIGPNPDFDGFHPLLALLRAIGEPRLLFWYVHVDDLEGLAVLARAAGRPLTPIEHVEPEDPTYSAYKRCSLSGPIDPVVPNLISWSRRRQEFTGGSTGATLTAFRPAHPEADQINSLFATLGIDQAVGHAPEPTLELELSTPRGSVVLLGVGNLASGFVLPAGN